MAATTAPGPGGSTIRIDDDVWAELSATFEPEGHARSVRLAFAALHVALRPGYRDVPHSPDAPGDPGEIAEWIDWEATMQLRRHVDACRLGVADAMDTAQRSEIGWRVAERLIRECGALGLDGGFVAGACADHVDVGSKADLVDGVLDQIGLIQAAGGMPVLLPMTWLTRTDCDADDYVEVYGEIIEQIDGPLFLHWLGPRFAPELEGYFPDDSFGRVMALDPEIVRGCKLSLLDPDFEVRIRRELLGRGQIVLTGDDLHFGRLIRGGDYGGDSTALPRVERLTSLGQHRLATGDFSHALLGIFDAVAAPAGLALALLANGDGPGFERIMAACEALGRHVFSEPTHLYKADLAFLAWLNGFQDDYSVVNHHERRRDREHYLRTAELAAAAGALMDAELAAERLREFAA